MRIRIPALLLACCSVVACAPREVSTYTMTAPTSAPATWTGRSLDEVLEAWGAPNLRESDGEGGTLLVYQADTGVTTSGGESAAGATPPDVAPHAPGQVAKSESLKRVNAKFWIDAKGSVYRFWFSPGVYKKGGDTPPPKKPKLDSE